MEPCRLQEIYNRSCEPKDWRTAACDVFGEQVVRVAMKSPRVVLPTKPGSRMVG